MCRIFMFCRDTTLDFKMNPIYHLSYTHHFRDRKIKKGSTWSKGLWPANIAEPGLPEGFHDIVVELLSVSTFSVFFFFKS